MDSLVCSRLASIKSSSQEYRETAEGENELAKKIDLQMSGATTVVFGEHQWLTYGTKDDTATSAGLEILILEEAHVCRPGRFSFKTLTKKYLKRDTHMNGRRCHDSLEDTIVTRDLVHLNIVCFNGDVW